MLMGHQSCSASADITGGAHDRNRTGDLVLTKDVLYRLIYVGGRYPQRLIDNTPFVLQLAAVAVLQRLNRCGAGSGNRTHVISLEG